MHMFKQPQTSKKQRHLIHNLKGFLNKNGGKIKGTNRVASYATRALRKEVLVKSFNDLWKMGVRLPDFKSFKERHMTKLANQWESEGLAAKTITNRISVFRAFSEMIGKNGKVRESIHYIKNPESIKVTSIAESDKTWRSNQVDVTQKITDIYFKEPRVGMQLLLQSAFALRVKESALIKPHQADKGTFITVSYGAKGGRDRVVRIENDFQRAVLNTAKKMVSLNQSMVPQKYSYKQWRDHYYWIVRSHGISRKALGVTSHGLRHERLNEIYKNITGHLSPIQGGKTVNKDTDKFARNIVAEIAGHSREDVSSIYLGGKS